MNLDLASLMAKLKRIKASLRIERTTSYLIITHRFKMEIFFAKATALEPIEMYWAFQIALK